MLTNNFWKVFEAKMARSKRPSKLVLTVESGAATEVSTTNLGSTTDFDILESALLYYPNVTSWPHGIEFGAGNTQPTRDDYCLQSRITTGISVGLPASWVLNETDDYRDYVFVYTIAATENVTIAEVGIFGYPGISGKYLYERTVLDEPVTINAGETKVVKYTIRFNYQ